MKKTGIMKKLIAVFLIAILGVAALPATSYAKEPTIMTKSKALTIGKNQLTYNNYYTSEDTLLGCFTAPEAGKYQFYITNNGEAYSSFHILDEDLAEIEASGYFNTIHPTEYVLFKNYNLKRVKKSISISKETLLIMMINCSLPRLISSSYHRQSLHQK